MDQGYFRNTELNDKLNIVPITPSYENLNIDSYLTTHTSMNLLAKNFIPDDDLQLFDDGKTCLSSARCSEDTYEQSTRSKSVSISSRRTNSYLSLHNESEIENSMFECEAQTARAEEKPKDKDSNIFSGFFELVNRASSFWTKKFSDRPSTIQEVSEVPSGRSSMDTFALRDEDKGEDQEPNVLSMKKEETASVVVPTTKNEVDATIWMDQAKPEENLSYDAELRWTAQDEKILLKYVEEYQSDWKKIAKLFASQNFTPKFLKDKYKSLKEQVSNKKTRFTHQEDLTIVKYYKKIGSNWDAIAKYLPERTPSMIKNRFYSSIRKKGLIDSLYKEIAHEAGSNSQVKEEISTAVGFANSYTSPTLDSNQFGFDPLSSVGMDITLDNEFSEPFSHIQGAHKFEDCNDHYEIFKSPCTYLNYGQDSKQCDDNTDRFFNSDELVNTRVYGNNFDLKEDFLDYQKSQGQKYFTEYHEEPVKSQTVKVEISEEKDVFADRPAQEKIELIKSKLSSIHMLFQETKFELEKIQKSFKA